MSPQRRTALVSVLAALVLVAIKLGTGLATDSLGLLSEAVHSGTDLVAALLTFFALGVAGRPADRSHPYGHGKAEHLAALAEAAILVGASLLVAYSAVSRLVGASTVEVDPAWYAFAAIGVVLVIDVSRAWVSLTASRRYDSPALQANALHFAADFAGSLAVLSGLALAAVGYPDADSVAALFVAVLVLAGAGRLIARNVDVLMDRAPREAEEAARAAVAGLDPPVELRRLRVREAAGRHFADVVIGVSPGAAVGQGHAAANAVEEALSRALARSDVVVHVEPNEEHAALRERALAAALGVPGVREVHNVSVVTAAGRNHVSLHLKLPGELPLEEAHAVANEVERAIAAALPDVEGVQTHLEPLAEAGRRGETPPAATVSADAAVIARIVEEVTGSPPRALRFLETPEGRVTFLTLAVDPRATLAHAHARAAAVEERIRRERPDVAEVIVHTEP
ncbi:MAG: cation diffusion facilitator family transporter [Thermoleophilia bacterium]|nr:cation diffusion facilitator family transporter [Thermoleophilia bacterium]